MVKILSGGLSIGNVEPEPYSTGKTTSKKRIQEPEDALPQSYDTSNENIGETLLRGAARTGARAAETVAGLPGSIAQAGFGIGNYLTGGAIPTYKEVQEKLPVSLPTPENIREFHEPYTGEYLKPQGPVEELGDELTNLITSLITPATGALGLASKAKLGKAASQLPRAAKIAGTAIGGSELVKQLGGSELAGEATKLGVLLASGIPGGRKALEDQAKKAYDITKDVADDVFIKAPKLKEIASKLAKQVQLGHLTEDKEAVQDLLKSFDKAFEKGSSFTKKGRYEPRGIQVKEAAQLEKDINQLLNSPKLPKQAQPPLLQLKEELQSALTEYGSHHPEWGKAYKESKEIWRALHARSGISKFLEKHFDLEELLENKLTKSVLFGGAIYSLPKTAAIVAPGIAASELLKAVELFARSPQAKKYYWDAIKAASKDNKNGFINSARKLDKIFSQEAPQELSELEPVSKRPKILSGGLSL